MRRFAALLAVLILMVSVAPVLACATDVAMQRQESACCREMHGACGEMAKTGCCRTEVRTDESPRIAADAPASEVQWVCVGVFGHLADQAHSAAGVPRQAPLEHLPPGLVTARVTVLRI